MRQLGNGLLVSANNHRLFFALTRYGSERSVPVPRSRKITRPGAAAVAADLARPSERQLVIGICRTKWRRISRGFVCAAKSTGFS